VQLPDLQEPHHGGRKIGIGKPDGILGFASDDQHHGNTFGVFVDDMTGFTGSTCSLARNDELLGGKHARGIGCGMSSCNNNNNLRVGLNESRSSLTKIGRHDTCHKTRSLMG